MTEDGAFQVSHPGADYENFPDVALVVEREKGHFLEAGFAYLNARPWRLAERGYFLKIKGTVVSHADKDVVR